MKLYMYHLDSVEDKLNSNIDVEVELDTHERFAFTAFTIKNVQELISQYEVTGECLSGSYFWSEGFILVKEISRDCIDKVVVDLIATGEFKSAMIKIN